MWAQALTTIGSIPFVLSDLHRTDFDPGCRDVPSLDLGFFIVITPKITGRCTMGLNGRAKSLITSTYSLAHVSRMLFTVFKIVSLAHIAHMLLQLTPKEIFTL